MPRPKLKAIIRFCRSITLAPAEKCWAWNGEITRNGYGVFWFGLRQYLAHRFAYLLHHGHDPIGMMVCHTCDNRKCVNPGHLFLGTAADNQRDKVLKGRHPRMAPRGESSPKAKLKDPDVFRIRVLIADGLSDKDIGKMYSVSHTAIWGIRNKRTWRHI